MNYFRTSKDMNPKDMILLLGRKKQQESDFYVKTVQDLLVVFMTIAHKFEVKKPIFVVFMWFMA